MAFYDERLACSIFSVGLFVHMYVCKAVQRAQNTDLSFESVKTVKLQ